MRKTKEILRLRWKQDRSFREIAKALCVGLGTASEVVSRATHLGLTWNEVEAIGEDELEARMYPPASTAAPRPEPDPATMHIELRRTGVTLRLLHEEYVLAHPSASPYGYTKFVELELHERRRRRIERSLKDSGLPADKTLATLNRARLPAAPRARTCLELH